MKAIDWGGLGAVREWTDVDAGVFAAQIAVRNQPAVLRGIASAWPLVGAAQSGAPSFCDYVRGFGEQHPVEAFVAPATIKGRFFYNETLDGFNFQRRKLPLGELLDTLLAHLDDPQPPCIYAGAIPLQEGLAGIREANPMPLVAADRRQLVSIWIGNRGRVGAHWDLPQNIAVVVAGRRRFTLFPTDQIPNLYVGPLEFTLAGQPISLVDFHAPDLERFPRFRKALEHAQSVELHPGDAIYIPSLWFHHVEALEPLGGLLNFWWRDAEPWMFTPRLTMLHALLSIRDMPEGERMAWRSLFDHYIFKVNGEPMAHLPEQARGLYGPMNDERLNQIRATLLQSLGVKLKN